MRSLAPLATSGVLLCTGGADRSALAIAGNDQTAKEIVIAFLDAIGYDAYDVGSIGQSWRFRPYHAV